MTGPTCGCQKSTNAAIAAKAVVTTITGSVQAGEAAGIAAGTIACKTTGSLITILYGAIVASITSITGYFIYFNNYMYKFLDDSESQEFDYININQPTITNFNTNLDTSSVFNTSNTNLLYCPVNNTLSQNFKTMMPTPKNTFQINYKPFALSANMLDLNIINTASKMKGTPENDLMIADKNGSSIFAIGGLNYMIAGLGADKFYFSLCSTDIIDGKVGVIEGFDINLDKIDFFCTKIDIHKDMISIFHNQVYNQDYTYVQVCGQEKCSAIALAGNIPLTVDDITLNDRWDVVAG